MDGTANGAGRSGRIARTWRAVVQTAPRFLEGESVRLRAGALTYITLFALVPALVVAFSVVQAFTGMEKIADLVHEFLLENLAVGARASIEPYLDRFITNAHATSAGVVGGFFLVVSAVSLFSNVDRALNDLWGISRARPLRQQAIIYWMGLTLGPVGLAASLWLAQSARAFLVGSGARFLAVVAGGLLTCAFLTLLYVIVPATRVRLWAAASGGLVAGLAWEIAKWGYAFTVSRFFRYSAIYGSVAAVPTFLLWIYVSWTLVLFGAKLAFVVQNAPSLIAGTHAGGAAAREILAGRTMLYVARAFDAGKDAPDEGRIAASLRALAEDVAGVVATLKGIGLLVPVAEGGLVPGRPLEKITLLDVRRAITGRTPTPVGRDVGGLASTVLDIEAEADRRLAGTTFRHLVDRAAQEGHELDPVGHEGADPATTPPPAPPPAEPRGA